MVSIAPILHIAIPNKYANPLNAVAWCKKELSHCRKEQ
jgi:hypothetical protein